MSLFRRRPIFQQQRTIGGFGRAGAAGAAGATGATGPAGVPGAAGLGPTQQEDWDSAEVNGAFVTPLLPVVTAQANHRLIPLMSWTESNVTVAGTNACAYNWGYPGVGSMMSNSALLSTARNTGTRDVPNLTSEVAAINTPLPSNGLGLQIALSVAPTGAPTVALRSWCLYFAIPALIT